jgi:hypothetical protein
VRNAIFSRVAPEPVRNPQLVAVSEAAMQECMGLSMDKLGKREQDVAEYFGGACARARVCVCVSVCVCICISCGGG